MWPGLVPDGRGILTIASGFVSRENRPAWSAARSGEEKKRYGEKVSCPGYPWISRAGQPREACWCLQPQEGATVPGQRDRPLQPLIRAQSVRRL